MWSGEGQREKSKKYVLAYSFGFSVIARKHHSNYGTVTW